MWRFEHLRAQKNETKNEVCLSQTIWIDFKFDAISGMSVVLLDLITHEPQPEWLGAFVVSLRFQQVLGNSKDFLGSCNRIWQRQCPRFHLKVDVLKLQCYRLALKKK